MAGPDAGPDIDAGVITEPSLVPRLPDGARRGPIPLGFEVRNGTATSWELERATNGGWAPVTRLSTEPEQTGATVVWDSFADVAEDTTVSLRFRAQVDGDALEAPFTIEVLNGPSPDRLLVVGLPLQTQPSGGAASTQPKAAVLLWDGLGGSVIGDPRVIDVVAGPKRLRAAPHGRAAIVLGEADGELGLVSTPLDAIQSSVRELARTTLPYGHPADVQWTADGRSLLVAGGLTNQPARPAALWRIRVSDGLSMGNAELVAELPGPPSALAVDRAGRALVVCGPGGPGTSKVVWYGADGVELDRVEFEELGPASALAIAPHGALALFVAASFLGDQMQLFSLGPSTLDTSGGLVTTIRSPTDVVFHPSSTAASSGALLTNFDDNKVTPLTLVPGRATPISAGTSVTNMPLADTIDLVERGTHAGSYVVTSTTATEPGGGQVIWGTFTVSGTATRGGAISLGTGTSTIPGGIALQR